MQIVLESPFECFHLRFNPSQPHIIAAGTITGQAWTRTSTPARRLRRKICHVLHTSRTQSRTNLNLYPFLPTQVVVWDISQREAELKKKNALSHKVQGWSIGVLTVALQRRGCLRWSIYVFPCLRVLRHALTGTSQGVVDDNSQKTAQFPPVGKRIDFHSPAHTQPHTSHTARTAAQT